MADTSGGVKPRIDWAALTAMLKSEMPGEWHLVGDNIAGAVRTYVKKKYGLEARMEGQDQVTSRGRLWVRWPA